MAQEDPLIDLLHRMQPAIKQLFTRFRMPPDIAESLLDDCVMVLLYRYDQLARPDRWLLHMVRFRCIRYWRERRRELSQRLDAEIRRWLEDEEVSAEERAGRRKDLERHIDRLPRRCRPLLRRTYRLAETPEGREVPLEPRPYRFGLQLPEDDAVRCLSQLMRLLLEEPALEVVREGPPSP